MKITISDTAWGVNRMNGERHERIVDTQCFDLALGVLPPIGPAGKRFEVTELTEDSLTLILNPRGKSVTVKRGEVYVYRPFSMDGGHYYTILFE